MAEKGVGARGAGRPPGAQNKVTRAAKEALQLAFEGIGGVDALTKWAKNNQTDFYKIWSKLLPTEIKNAEGEGSFRLEIVREIVDATTAHANRTEDDPTPP